eukprot:scaffold2157_cov376-Prasinococcus_capsulatus_cf.AAC.11
MLAVGWSFAVGLWHPFPFNGRPSHLQVRAGALLLSFHIAIAIASCIGRCLAPLALLTHGARGTRDISLRLQIRAAPRIARRHRVHLGVDAHDTWARPVGRIRAHPEASRVVGAGVPPLGDLSVGVVAGQVRREELTLAAREYLDGVGYHAHRLGLAHGGDVSQGDALRFFVAKNVGVEAQMVFEEILLTLQQDLLLQGAHPLVKEPVPLLDAEEAAELLLSALRPLLCPLGLELPPRCGRLGPLAVAEGVRRRCSVF